MAIAGELCGPPSGGLNHVNIRDILHDLFNSKADRCGVDVSA